MARKQESVESTRKTNLRADNLFGENSSQTKKTSITNTDAIQSKTNISFLWKRSAFLYGAACLHAPPSLYIGSWQCALKTKGRAKQMKIFGFAKWRSKCSRWKVVVGGPCRIVGARFTFEAKGASSACLFVPFKIATQQWLLFLVAQSCMRALGS